MVAISTLLAVAVDGLAFGAFLALLGVGITLVFGLGEVLNLAIGVFAILAVLVAVAAINNGIGVLLGAVIGAAAVGVFSLLVDRSLFTLVYRSEGEERILLGIFVTLGLTVMLDGILFNLFPSQYSLPVNLGTTTIGPLVLASSSLLVIGVSAVLLALLFGFLRWTFLGKATQTVFQDEVGAYLVGVEPRRIRTLVFVLSSVVAAIAGLVYATSATLDVASGFEFTTFALIVSIVGGVRSIEGAVGAGVILGLVITYANFFIGSFIANMILFATAIVVLLVNPEAIPL